MYVNRKLADKAKGLLGQFHVLLVTGARQSGKSTLLRKIFPDHKYLSLDDLRIRSQANEEPASFFDYYQSPVIIDEVQYAPDLLPYIKLAVDENKFCETSSSYILTGSQKFAVMDQIQESLAGRMAILNLNTLSVEELRDQDLDLPAWTEIVYRSLYPEPYLNAKLDLNLWFEGYVQAWLNRDIRQNLKNSHLRVFDKFLQLIAVRLTGEENYNSIAKELGVSRLTVQSWAALLEKTQILYSLQPYHSNLGKRIIKSAKVYFFDTGLANYLSGFLNPDQISNHIMTGPLFENFIVSEVLKFFDNRGIKAPLYFFRENNGTEVDLIIDLKDRLLAIEIKSTSMPNKSHIKSLLRFAELSDKPVVNLLVCNSGKELKLDNLVRVVPWQDLSLVLRELTQHS